MNLLTTSVLREVMASTLLEINIVQNGLPQFSNF